MKGRVIKPPAVPDPGHCKSCGAEIVWVRTAAGKPMPLDPDPVPGGNVRMDEEGFAHVEAPLPLDDERPRYVSHFATCPNAKRHRKR